MKSMIAVLVLALAVGCSDSGRQDAWEVDHVEESGALLSVWGTGGEVWAVGGQRGQGLVLHDDGSGWRSVVIDAEELLTWTYGFRQDDVYAVGHGGLVLHYDGDTWERIASGTTADLYGVWGASSDEVWIVGGDASGPVGSAVLLRGSGTEFSLVEDVPSELLPSALYKAYGSPNGFLGVGTSGAILSFDGDTWRREASPTSSPLFSLWGRAENDIFAVGGLGVSEILHFDGDEWSRVEDDLVGAGLSGVYTAPDESMVAVGDDSYVVEVDLEGGAREALLPGLDPMPELHGVWGDEDGVIYTVGGNLSAFPAPMTGVIFRRD